MRNSSDTMTGVPPRPPNEPPDHAIADLVSIAHAAETANNALREAVLTALNAGGSVRTVAAAARLSPTTVQKWKREALN